jgi:hypothetical protein
VGRGFEVQGSQQLPVWTIEQVDRFNVFPPAERRSLHRQVDHLMSEHGPDLRYMQPRVDERHPTVCRKS